jgi:hypothetical protein
VDVEAEVGERAVEGWNDLLVAHLRHAGGTLVWTLIWTARRVLVLVFFRYVGVLGAGGVAEGSPDRPSRGRQCLPPWSPDCVRSRSPRAL